MNPVLPPKIPGSPSPGTPLPHSQAPTPTRPLPRRPSGLLSPAFTTLLAASIVLATFPAVHAASQVALWDSTARFSANPDLQDRSAWRAVPTELFAFEADPAKAASDPGYYGREYVFKGDAVVENRHIIAVFRSQAGRVDVYSRHPSPAADTTAPAKPGPSRKILELGPMPTQPGQPEPSAPGRLDILRNATDDVALEVATGSAGTSESGLRFTFGKSEIIEVKPVGAARGIRILGAIDYGIVPDFIGDDLLFSPNQQADTSILHVPAENMLLGLLRGGADLVTLTWPAGNQQVRLGLQDEPAGRRMIGSIDFMADGRPLYLAALSAPGIWHREPLKPTHLEKETAIPWKRPFPAKWKTQFNEAGVKTTFTFRESKGQIWRGVPGSYIYPVWFQADQGVLQLGKKIPPKGEAVIYCVEGQNTPPEVATPVDILKATLGRAACEPILDVAGRRLRSHHRRGGDSVHRACTCGFTEAIQAVFEAGEEVEKRQFIELGLADMTYFVQRHLERIDEYKRFAESMIRHLEAVAGAHSGSKADLDALTEIARQIPEACAVQRDNMKGLDHAADLTRRTMALTMKKEPGNLAAFMELLKAWRAMGGAQDGVIAQCHVTVRNLFQTAGYRLVNSPEAVALARDIRRQCRECLRNPDGYEIWADY